MVLLAAVIFLTVAGFVLQFFGARADKKKYPPPGRLIDVGCHRLHWLESGQGIPVVFESGVSASCLNWTHLRSQVAGFARACAYDRAGLGWSDPGPKPRVASRLVAEVRTLIEGAGLPKPMVLVGHSFGGLLVQAYAIKYPGEVAGLVLIDPLPASEWANPSPAQRRMLGRAVGLSRRGALLARIGVVRFALKMLTGGARRTPKWIAKATSGRGESVITRLIGEVRKMPPETWPMIQAHWCLPKTFQAMGDSLEALPASSAEATALGPLPLIPITILSGSHSTPAQLADRDRIVKGSPAGRHVVAERSGHWVHLDQPELVLEAIREAVRAISQTR